MIHWRLEAQLLLRSPLVMIALLFLFSLSAVAVWAGLHEVATQRDTITHVRQLQAEEIAAASTQYAIPSGAGDAAYYTFHATWNEPSPLAFIALGQRDVLPWVLRVRALGLQSQLHDSEALNPQLTLAGHFDFAFVLIYLLPLIVIALMHDLVSGEREAGRLMLLRAMPITVVALWQRRVVLRFLLVAAALLLPLLVGVVLAGLVFAGAGFAGSVAASIFSWWMVAIVFITLLYTAFWFGLCLLFGASAVSSSANAARLLGCWLVLTLLLPAMANIAITRAIPVGQGIDLTLAQRQIVHSAWDIPKQATIDRFVALYPQWHDKLHVKPDFQWDWYFVMHKVGDDAVAAQFSEYRQALRARETATARIGWLLPAVAVQLLLERIAETDLTAHLHYEDQIADFHSSLLQAVLPDLIAESAFTAADFEKLPAFKPRIFSPSLSIFSMAALVVCTLLAFCAGKRRLRCSV